MFQNQYQSSGKGVAKEQKHKPRIMVFFEIYFRKFWHLTKLSLLYFLFCIPIVTIGPATAAFFKILKNYTQEKNAFLWMDFWETFKKNWKQSLLLELLSLIPAAGIAYAMSFYLPMAKENTAYYPAIALCIVFAVILLAVNVYAYLMIVSVELPFGTILKNALLLIFAGLKNTFLALFLPAVLIVLFSLLVDILPWTLILIPLGLLSLLGFMVVFNCYPVIEKYVINPFYEAKGASNPDYDYLNTQGETVFEDKGGKEKPVELQKKHKGKVIR